MPFPIPTRTAKATSPLPAERRATLYERPAQPGLLCRACARPYDPVWELHIHNAGLPVDAFAALVKALSPPGGILAKLPYGWQIIGCPCQEPKEEPAAAEAEAEAKPDLADPATDPPGPEPEV